MLQASSRREGSKKTIFDGRAGWIKTSHRWPEWYPFNAQKPFLELRHMNTVSTVETGILGDQYPCIKFVPKTPNRVSVKWIDAMKRYWCAFGRMSWSGFHSFMQRDRSINCCGEAEREEIEGLNERKEPKYILALTSNTCEHGENTFCWVKLCNVNEGGLHCWN
jgi:hypothetical protein